jgi:hypothetical protein
MRAELRIGYRMLLAALSAVRSRRSLGSMRSTRGSLSSRSADIWRGGSMEVSFFTVRARRTRTLSRELKTSWEDTAEIAIAAVLLSRPGKPELGCWKCPSLGRVDRLRVTACECRQLERLDSCKVLLCLCLSCLRLVVATWNGSQSQTPLGIGTKLH